MDAGQKTEGAQQAEEDGTEQITYHVGAHNAKAFGGVDAVDLTDKPQGGLTADGQGGAHSLPAHPQQHGDGQADDHGAQVAKLLKDQGGAGGENLFDIGAGAHSQLDAQDDENQGEHRLGELDFLFAANLLQRLDLAPQSVGGHQHGEDHGEDHGQQDDVAGAHRELDGTHQLTQRSRHTGDSHQLDENRPASLCAVNILFSHRDFFLVGHGYYLLTLVGVTPLRAYPGVPGAPEGPPFDRDRFLCLTPDRRKLLCHNV